MQADVVIPAGGYVALAGGALDASCTDLVVAGTLQTNAAPVTRVRNVVIEPGGLIDAGTSSFHVAGSWINGGSFAAGRSTIVFEDGCGVDLAVISGSTPFYNLSFASTGGKTWRLAAGSRQTVTGEFSVQGAHLASSTTDVPAYVDAYGARTFADAEIASSVIVGPLAVPILGLAGIGILMAALGAVGMRSRGPGRAGERRRRGRPE